MSYRYGKAKVDNFIKRIWTKEVSFTTTRAGGHGGQHMQKNETAVQMHQNPQETKIFPQDHLPRLYQKAEHYCTEHKIIRIDARVHRYQKANKEVIFRKFAKLIKSVFTQDPVRKKSQKPQRADEKRLAQKRKRARKLQVKNNLSRYQ